MLNFLIFIAIGGIAGWLASVLMKGGGSGILINIILGIVGGFVGGWAFDVLGIQIASGFGSFITALIGAVVLILLARLLTGKR